MAEQTEKAFLKQPKVFVLGRTSKKSGKGKRLVKGGNRFWKSTGLGFKTPGEAIEDMRRDTGTFQRTYRRVIIGQCRPLSKTVRFNVVKAIQAGSSAAGKRALTGM